MIRLPRRAMRVPIRAFLPAAAAWVALVLVAGDTPAGGAPAGEAAGEAAREARAPSFALRAAHIMPVDPNLPWVIDHGVIIVRDGKIAAIGADVDIPPDLRVIDAGGGTVIPGLVAAASLAGGAHAGDESIAAGYRAVDTFDRHADFATTLAEGVTTIHIGPGTHRLVTGVGAVVKLAGPPDRRVLRDASDLSINLGDAVFNPPRHVVYAQPASSDVPIVPAQLQRPASRVGQILALDEALSAARTRSADTPFDMHLAALGRAWDADATLRIGAQRAVDIETGVRFLQDRHKHGYIVGGAEAHRVARVLAEAGIPLVYRAGDPFRYPADDMGFDPDAVDDRLVGLSDVTLALAAPEGQPTAQTRLAAATALRGGLSERKVIEGITRVPAEVLGVADRVGSLSVGKDADLVVMTGPPLNTTSHVSRVYVGGVLAFEPPARGPLVVRAGTIWLGPDRRLRGGAILVEDGRIQAVGPSVPHPPFARVIDAGPGGFVAPGFIDANNHVLFEGDRASTPPDVTPSALVGAADDAELRLARSGITTILLSSHRVAGGGSQVSAVKTAGASRDARVVRATAAVMFDARDADPNGIADSIGKRLKAGQAYLDKWKKYEKDLAQWKADRAKGKATPAKSASENDRESEAGTVDPITGIWDGTVTGGPLPEPMTGKVALRLTGNEIEGRVIDPPPPMEHKIIATLDGDRIQGRIEVDTQGMGFPEFEATLDRADHFAGSLTFQGISVDFDAERIEKTDVEFKVVKRRTRGKDGRPLPPKVDESLEPLRALLEKKIPAVVRVRTAAQIDAVLRLFTKPYDAAVVLLGAEDASAVADALVERGVGVIVPRVAVTTRRHVPYVEADDLQRRHVKIAFQSDAEDGGRTLSRVALYAVERGLSADAALAALTSDAAAMLKIDDRVGSLEPGKDGDLVIFTGHPFEAGSAITHVIVGGEEVNPR